MLGFGAGGAGDEVWLGEEVLFLLGEGGWMCVGVCGWGVCGGRIREAREEEGSCS